MDQSPLSLMILGIIQGITEFLPVSSSAHLILYSWFLDSKSLPMFLNVSLHVGTLLAILVYFAKDWLDIFSAFFKKLKTGEKSKNDILLPLMVGSIPAGIIGLTLKDTIETYFHNPFTLIYPLVIVGLALWLVDKFKDNNNSLSGISLLQAFVIGIGQSCALIPGVSRSGATILSARLFGFNRIESAKFSFLLGTPAMFGAFLIHAKEISLHIGNPWFYTGIFVSFLVGMLTIRYFLKFITKFGFLAFAIYRILLAIGVWIAIH